MSISSTGIYGSATFVNSDLFNDVESLKEQVTTLSTSYLDTIESTVKGRTSLAVRPVTGIRLTYGYKTRLSTQRS